MRALRYHGRQDLRLEEVDEPRPGPGEVALDVLFNGLCGSDVHEYFDGPIYTTEAPHPLTGCARPAILGHELSGQVVELGTGVEDVRVGDLVAVLPLQSCGTCPRCSAGCPHLCRRVALHGYHREGGGLSDRTVVRGDMVHVLPEGVSGRHGALVEPMAVSHRAVRRVGARAGDLVVVHGAGPIGLGALLALRVLDARVGVSDPSPVRREAARRLGAEHTFDPADLDVVEAVRDLTGGVGAAGTVDAAGVPSSLSAAVRATRPDGTVVLVAHHEQPLDLRSWSLISSELRLTGSLLYTPDDYREVIAAMAAGHYPLGAWVEEIELTRVVEDGLERLRRQDANKVLVRLCAEDET
jgi:(R,R)-butanediol dehydrogenase / meso-butanediol dehydrogenase / diacetyl reductase